MRVRTAIGHRAGTELQVCSEIEHPDLVIARLAAGQFGVVARRQLLAAGLTARQIARRLETGRLHRAYRGVYAVGHRALRLEGAYIAATLAAGLWAVISHRSAAMLWDVRSTARSSIEVTTPMAGRRQIDGIDLHTSARLGRDQVTVHRGVAVTTLERTIADLANVLPRGDLTRTIERADAQWLLDIDRTHAAASHRKGAALLREVSGAWAPAPTRSELEDRLLLLLGDARISAPLVNTRLHGFEVDFAWPAQRLVAETDGHAFHSSHAAVERDRHRDAVLTLHGYRVLRFTWAQVTRRPEEVVGALRAALAI